MSDFRLDDFQIEVDEGKKKIYSLNMYEEDWIKFNKIKTYKILEENNLSYTKSEVFSWGIELLKEKYNNIERECEKIKLRRGKRAEGTDNICRQTSVYITSSDSSFINDFLFHKVWKEKQIEYTRAEMIHEMISLIEKEEPNIFI